MEIYIGESGRVDRSASRQGLKREVISLSPDGPLNGDTINTQEKKKTQSLHSLFRGRVLRASDTGTFENNQW